MPMEGNDGYFPHGEFMFSIIVRADIRRAVASNDFNICLRQGLLRLLRLPRQLQTSGRCRRYHVQGQEVHQGQVLQEG